MTDDRIDARLRAHAERWRAAHSSPAAAPARYAGRAPRLLSPAVAAAAVLLVVAAGWALRERPGDTTGDSPNAPAVSPWATTSAGTSECGATAFEIEAEVRRGPDGVVVFDAKWFNRSDLTCAISFKPEVHIMGPSGELLQEHAVHTDLRQIPPLAPGRYAHGPLVWGIYCGPAVPAYHVEVTVPGVPGRVRIDVSGALIAPPCRSGYPHDGTVGQTSSDWLTP